MLSGIQLLVLAHIVLHFDSFASLIGIMSSDIA